MEDYISKEIDEFLRKERDKIEYDIREMKFDCSIEEPDKRSYYNLLLLKSIYDKLCEVDIKRKDKWKNVNL